MRNSGSDVTSAGNTPAVALTLKSAYVLVRNVEFVANRGRAVNVKFSSETREKESEVTITQNTMWHMQGPGVVRVENVGIRAANVWLTRNDIRYNNGLVRDSCIEILNATLDMEGNVVYNNSAQYILHMRDDLTGSALPKRVVANLFWLNVGLEQSRKHTIAASVYDLVFFGNALQNPANSLEFIPFPTYK